MVAIGELSDLLMVRMLVIRKPDKTSHYDGMRGGGGSIRPHRHVPGYQVAMLSVTVQVSRCRTARPISRTRNPR